MTMIQKCLLGATLALAFAAGGPALAQGHDTVQTGVIAPSPMPVLAREPFVPSVHDLEAVQGQFALDNGSTLSVVRRGTRVWITLDERADQEIKAVAPSTFVVVGAATRLEFEHTPNGNVFAVRVLQEPNLALARP